MRNTIIAVLFVAATCFTVTGFAGVSFGAYKSPLLIASVFAHSGDAAEENSPNYRMVRLAIKKANEAGGVLGREIQLLELDNKSTALGSRQAALEAIEAGAIAVIGPSWSSHAMAMAPELQRAGIPMIGTTTTAPEVTKVGDYIFRACYTNQSQASLLARFARKELNASTAALLVVAGDVFSEDLATQFEKAFSKLGGTVSVKEGYLLSSMNFDRQLTAIAKVGADVVFVPGFARDSGLILKQARDMGMTNIFMGGDGWTALEEYPFIDALEGENYYASHWHPESEAQASRDFLAYMRQELGPDALDVIDSGNPVAFDAINLVIDAIRRAGSADPAAVRDALSRTRNFPGVTGSISFDESRNPIKPLVVLRIEGTETRYVKTITPE